MARREEASLEERARWSASCALAVDQSKRVLQSVVIEIDGDEAEDFGARDAAACAALDADTIRSTLVESGQWTALRTRPYSKVPAPDSEPDALFVTATDTNPLAADPGAVIVGNEEVRIDNVELSFSPVWTLEPCVYSDFNAGDLDGWTDVEWNTSDSWPGTRADHRHARVDGRR